MKAAILAGGTGTRLRPLTLTIPKPLLPIGNKAILEDIVIKLKRHGATEIILLTGYLSEYIQAYMGDGAAWGIPITYAKEGKPLGTAGCLTMIRQYMRGESEILLMNGDIFTELDFSRLREQHQSGGQMLTVGCVRHEYTCPFGVVKLEGDEIRGVEEKPTTTSVVSAGIYMLSPAVVDFLEDDTFCTMPTLIERLVARGHAVRPHLITEYWLGIETITELEDAISTLAKAEQQKEASDAGGA